MRDERRGADALEGLCLARGVEHDRKNYRPDDVAEAHTLSEQRKAGGAPAEGESGAPSGQQLARPTVEP